MEEETLGAPIRLLLVEDDEIDREAVRRLLGAGYVVTDVATGKEALAVTSTVPPDAVLLDFRLPDMDGIDLVPILVEKYVPVILLTGEDSPEVIVQAMQKGAQDYLVKGHIGRTALARAIDNAIEKVALKRDLALQQAQMAEQALALERSNRQVRALASALTLAEQRERRRISQMLHDHVQQMLYGIQMRTYLIGLDAPESSKVYIHEHLTEMESLVEEAIQSTRTLTVELSPPVLQSEGLGAAFNWLANQMGRLYDLEVQLNLTQDYQLASEDLRVLIFQLVRELLFNVVKHARVSRAKVAMRLEDERFVVCVEDDGIGFDPTLLAQDERQDGGGFGLYSIRERLALFGGEVTIESHPGQGTRVTLSLPQGIALNEDLVGQVEQS
jgi:signal transduction histidine kinase